MRQISIAILIIIQISLQGQNSFKVGHYLGIQSTDSTYIIHRNDKLVDSAFHIRYFDNCPTKIDSLNAIKEKRRYGNNWRVKLGCSSYISLSEKQRWCDSLNMSKEFSLICPAKHGLNLFITLNSDSTFYWESWTGHDPFLSGGFYHIEADSLLVFNSSKEITEEFGKIYKEKTKDVWHSYKTKRFISHKFIYKNDTIFFINNKY